MPAARVDVSYFCYHPGPELAGCLPSVLGGSGGAAQAGAVCLHPVADKMEVVTNSPRVVLARQQMLSSRWSTIRWTVRSATRPASARCRSCTTTGITKGSRTEFDKVHKPKMADIRPHIVSMPSAASCARAASASVTRLVACIS